MTNKYLHLWDIYKDLDGRYAKVSGKRNTFWVLPQQRSPSGTYEPRSILCWCEKAGFSTWSFGEAKDPQSQINRVELSSDRTITFCENVEVRLVIKIPK